MTTVTGFSGLFDTIQPTGLTLSDSENIRKRISKVLSRSEGARELKELLLTLNGAAAGAAASATVARVGHTVDAGNPVVNGGARTIDTVTVIGRNTTAADETAIDAMLNQVHAPTSYPVDASGNGGGGKLS